MAISRNPFFGFLRGKPPFKILAEYLARDSDFLDDARRILELTEDAYVRLATQLAKTDAFLSRTDLIALVGQVLGDGADRIASIIHRLGGMIHDADMDVVEAMNTLATAIEEKTDGLELQERQTLCERLRRLVAEPIGIAKQCKARQLVDAIGAELDDFRIICDIRPIFDRRHERIDGAIPLTVLRLEYSKPDGESDVVELRITEKQITEFGEKMADANLKLRMIKDLLTGQRIPIPRTKSTVSEDES